MADSRPCAGAGAGAGAGAAQALAAEASLSCLSSEARSVVHRQVGGGALPTNLGGAPPVSHGELILGMLLAGHVRDTELPPLPFLSGSVRACCIGIRMLKLAGSGSAALRLWGCLPFALRWLILGRRDSGR